MWEWEWMAEVLIILYLYYYTPRLVYMTAGNSETQWRRRGEGMRKLFKGITKWCGHNVSLLRWGRRKRKEKVVYYVLNK